MARIVALLNLKGGVGKTSAAVHLAAALSTPRRRVVLADADPQRSASRWAEGGRLPFAVQPLAASRGAGRFKGDLDRMGAAADLVIIDCPPELAETAQIAALLADLLLIPATPSALDLWAAQSAVELAREARNERGGALPLVSLIPSRLISRTREAGEMADTLRAFGEPVAPPTYQRIAVARASIQGGVVRPATAAGREFAALARHVLNRLRRI